MDYSSFILGFALGSTLASVISYFLYGRLMVLLKKSYHKALEAKAEEVLEYKKEVDSLKLQMDGKTYHKALEAKAEEVLEYKKEVDSLKLQMDGKINQINHELKNKERIRFLPIEYDLKPKSLKQKEYADTRELVKKSKEFILVSGLFSDDKK